MKNKGSEKKILRDRWLKNFFPSDIFNRVRLSQNISPGTCLVAAVVLATVFLWAFFAIGDELPIPIILTKIAAFSALAMLAMNHMLTIRSRILEKMFRGLDRMYRVHHVIGQTAFLLIIAHPLLLLIARWENTSAVLDLLLPGRDFGITLGLVSFYILLILLFITISLKITYHKWHLSHHLMVLPLFFAFLHAVASGTYMGNHMLLRTWVAALSLTGMVSYIYTMILYPHVGPKHMGKVAEVRNQGEIIEVTFEMQYKRMEFKAGQFVFIRFLSLPQSYETFPFSLSGSPASPMLRISAKKSGDFTKNILPTLKKGDTVKIWGPYGAFGEHYHYRKDDSIWIAGGIGVTPFLSMMHQEKRREERKVLFVWACNTENEAVYDKEIREALREHKHENIKYILWTSSTMGRITAEEVLRLSKKHMPHKKEPLERLDVFICGPPPMMNALSNQFIDKGLRGNQIFFEDFSLV